MSVYKIQAFGYLLNVFQAEWSVVSYQCDDGESVRHFSASLPWKIRNAQSPYLLQRLAKSPGRALPAYEHQTHTGHAQNLNISSNWQSKPHRPRVTP